MNMLAHIRIGAKLLLAPLTVILLLIGLAVTAFYGIGRQQAALENIYQVRFTHFMVASRSAKQAFGTVTDNYQLLSAAGSGTLPAEQVAPVAKQMQATLQTVARQLGGLQKDPGTTVKEQALVKLAVEQIAAYRQSVAQLHKMLPINGNAALAKMGVAEEDFELLDARLNNLVQLEEQLAKDAYGAAARSSQRVQRLLIGLTALSVVLALIVNFVVRRQIVTAIDAIRNAAMDLRGGDLTRRVAVKGRDEVAQAAGAFNELIASFQVAVRRVLAEANSVSHSVQQMGDAAQCVVSGSDRQAMSASAVAATMEQITVAISSIADSAQAVKATSRQSFDSTEEGSATLVRLLHEIGELRQAFGTTTASVHDFIRSTTAIIDLTRQVKGLAGQTNLLALNAAIEAARVGEQGRGFAVVADEVRKLAESSTDAANRIDQVTQALALQSTTVEQALEAGARNLADSQSQLDRLVQNLSEARGAVGAANRGVDEIAGAVSEQSAGTQDIARHIDEIARMAEENSGAVQRTASVASELEQLAGNLQLAVGGFRV